MIMSWDASGIRPCRAAKRNELLIELALRIDRPWSLLGALERCRKHLWTGRNNEASISPRHSRRSGHDLEGADDPGTGEGIHGQTSGGPQHRIRNSTEERHEPRCG